MSGGAARGRRSSAFVQERNSRQRTGGGIQYARGSTDEQGIPADGRGIDVAVIMRFGATSSRSRPHSQCSSLCLLKSGSDGLLLRTLPSSPSSTNPQTAHSVNSQTEKRTGSRKKTAETARGQDQNGGDTGQNGQGECEEQAILGLTGTAFQYARHGRPTSEPRQLPRAHAQTPRSAPVHLQQRRHPVQPEVIAESG